MTDEISAPRDAPHQRALMGGLIGVVLLVGALLLGLLFEWEFPESKATRCARVFDETTQHRVDLMLQKSPAALPPRPSDSSWYAEHCWERNPR